MDVHNLDRIFKPKRIALIGVTINPKSVGGKVLGNLVGSGFRGVVYPVNPDFEAVMGISCFAGLRQLPRPVDVAVICAPAARVPALVRECGEAGIPGVVIVSSGFRETGAEGKALEEQVLDPTVHDRERFDCGVPALNEYLQRYAEQHRRKGISAMYVLVDSAAVSTVLGYYTPSAAEVDVAQLAEADSRRLPRYPVPCFRMGRHRSVSLLPNDQEVVFSA